MRNPKYQYAISINGAFNIISSKLPMALDDIMTTANGLQLVVSECGSEIYTDKKGNEQVRMLRIYHPEDGREIKGKKHPSTTWAAAYFVMRHIIGRTLQFGKLFEFVELDQIIWGMPNLAIAPAAVPPFDVKFALSYLSPPHRDFLIKLKFKDTVTPLYSINWPPLISLLCITCFNKLLNLRVDREDENRELKVSNQFLTGYAKAVLCLQYLEPFEPAFKFLATYPERITRIDVFEKALKKQMPKRISFLSFDCELADCNRTRDLKRQWRECMQSGEPFLGYEP